MIEEERRTTKIEKLFAITSGALIGFAVGGYLFLHIPPLVSAEILLAGFGEAFGGVGLILKREHGYWRENGREGL